MGLPGSQKQVERLVEQHYQSLYRYAFRLTGSAADADDLTQETFCKAQMRLNQLREAARAKAWLFSILRNTYLHRVRDRKNERLVDLEDAGEVADRFPETLPEVEPEKLQQVLDELPEGFRTPIILYYFEEFSYRDIAEHMQLPIGTVMSRLSRAKGHLRDRLLTPAPMPATAERREGDGL